MRKRFALFVIILLLNSCAVQKKQLYVFSHYGYVTKIDHPSEAPPKKIESNITSVGDNYANNCAHELVDTLKSPMQREVRLLKQPKLHPGRINRVIKEQAKDARTEKYQADDLSTIEKPKQRKIGDSLLYAVASVMGLAVMGLTRLMRPRVTRITRWAKANPKKTQGIIAGIQLPLLGLGAMNGHNLYQMGYDTSDTMLYTFGAATAIGFLAAPFKPRQDMIAMPKQVNRQRLAFLSIAISSLMMMVGFGNRIERDYPNTSIARTVNAFDKDLFYTDNTNDIHPDLQVASKSKILQDIPAKAGMSGLAAFLAIFFLSILACAGLCLIVGGITGAASSVGAGIAAVVGGIALLIISIKGIESVGKKRKLAREQEAKQPKL